VKPVVCQGGLPRAARDLAERCARRQWSYCARLVEKYEHTDETYALDVARWACEEGHGSACMKVKQHRAACELGVMEGCWKRFDREGFLLLQRACASGNASDGAGRWRSTRALDS
jgi:hypothetical protein